MVVAKENGVGAEMTKDLREIDAPVSRQTAEWDISRMNSFRTFRTEFLHPRVKEFCSECSEGIHPTYVPLSCLSRYRSVYLS